MHAIRSAASSAPKVWAPRKPRPYFILLSRAHGASAWVKEFGAYDRSDVDFEMDDMRETDRFMLKRGERPAYRIVKAPSGRKADCDAAVAKLGA